MNTESTTVIAEMTIAAVAACGAERRLRASSAIINAAPASATLKMPMSRAVRALTIPLRPRAGDVLVWAAPCRWLGRPSDGLGLVGAWARY